MTTKNSANTKSSKYSTERNIIPVCIFVSVLTAVLVTLIFSFGFTKGLNELIQKRGKNEYSGNFSSQISKGETDAAGIILLNNKAVIDMALSGKTGFLYVSTKDCAECSLFESRLGNIKNDSEIDNIYHYVMNTGSTSDDDYYAQALTVGTDSVPALLFFRDGMIYDRLDDARDAANLSTFVAKYKK